MNYGPFKVILGLVFFVTTFSYSQAVIEDNQQLFNDFTYRQGSVYRTASGKPGPEYWQNSADYKIEATLDDQKQTITGKLSLMYTNNSPEDLDFVWLYLEQNRFTLNSRGTLTTPVEGNRYNGDVDGGYTISNLSAKVNKGVSTKSLINDTRMQVFFDEPLQGKGGKATISMDFVYKIPVKGMDRMGRLDTQNGTIYSIAQWYPRVAVFDDVVGWNVEPYLGAGEFYCDYGNYEYAITVPFDHIVVGSGELVNPEEVLTKTQRDRLNDASKSDKTVFIISPEEVGQKTTRLKNSGSSTWRFKMENTRDVAFASSKGFIWDAAKINLANGKKSLAQSVYPIESNGSNAWSRSTEYTKASIEYYSQTYFQYPYPTAINVASEVGGMEYPGVSFCSWKSTRDDLWGVTDHEFGHNWFPMIVGSNERRYAWMDEGFNTFINYYSTNAFNKGEYSSSNRPIRSIIRYLNWEHREGIDVYPDVSGSMNLAYVGYYKPAVGLIVLREYILGPERFDNAFQSYIKTWAYKHPQPNDFFNHMENVAGENLSWYWKGWFYGNKNIDIAVTDVKKETGGYSIILTNETDFPMPVLLNVTYADGSSEMIDLPVEIWQKGDQWAHFLPTSKIIQRVEFDPKKQVPDVNVLNDVWVNTEN
ncbi:M1 family metallopeptidase [Ulvibacter antarcticus]|uniref:Peptidase M1-like protein n=1 Tax=Ulvibacter antarcticus TaxID=442714 RepID=A0A3L9YA53_9FLAO|nr:M1 family metallopeptidase [Ulvibacter antarcticus]RMA57264.1 peptidase M1-like protein [Ulvibacter antarcticus]